MKLLRYVLSFLAVMLAAGGAYHAGSRATRRRQMASKERELVDLIGSEGRGAIEAADRARVHEAAADEASKKAKRRIEAIAAVDPELSVVISALNTQKKRGSRSSPK